MPAGSLDKLKVALRFGADAVYAGPPLFSLRARNNDFSMDELAQGIQWAHERQKKVYLTLNVFARNLKLKPFAEAMDDLVSLGADAFIMSDPGLIAMVRERYPEQEIHLSVQANCMNWQSAKFWQQQGVRRIILSRELRLREIEEIHRQAPEVELEAFVHGSICIAYSGRCLLSHYMSYRDANQGVCDNSCRYPYRVYEKSSRVQESNEYLLEDLRSPGEYYPIEEDDNGTYIMNARDLCLIEHLDELVRAGVVSLKVEGRSKSEFYVALVASCYKRAIDDLMAGRPFDQSLLGLLSSGANRGFSKGLFTPDQDAASMQHYEKPEPGPLSSYVGRVLGQIGSRRHTFDATGSIRVNQRLQILSPYGLSSGLVAQLWDAKSHPVSELHAGRKNCFIELDCALPEGSYLLHLPESHDSLAATN